MASCFIHLSFLFFALSGVSTINDHEKEMSPQYYTKNKVVENVIEDYIATITEVSDRVRENVPYEGEVRYGKGERQTVDIYGRDSIPEDSPILVYIHGGYWQLLDKNMSALIVHPMWKNGVRVIVAGYDLAPSVSIGDIIKETKELGTFVLNYAAEKKVKDVWIFGHSAGAHLAASLLTENWSKEGHKNLLKGLILVAGLYDLKPVIGTSFNENLKLDETNAEKWSPMSQKKINLPINEDFKVLVFVGDNDSPAFIRQSREYSNLLKKQGINSEFHLMSDMDHFDIASNLQYEDFNLTRTVAKLFSKDKE